MLETVDPAELVAEALFARTREERAHLVGELAELADACGDEVTEALARGLACGLRGPLAQRVGAVEALARFGGRAAPVVAELARAAEADLALKVRVLAAHACVRILPERPLDPRPYALVLALADRDVRHLALDLLADLGPLARPARPALARALASDDGAIAQAALRALEAIGLDGLADALASPVAAARRHAVLRLDARTGELSRAVVLLERALGDPDAAVRRGAARALARCGSYARCALPALVRCLQDPDREARWWSALSAVALGLRSGDVLSVVADACERAPVDLRRLAGAAL